METATISKEHELLQWAKHAKVFSYVQVREWSYFHHYIRSERTIRDFVQEGRLRRIPNDEAIKRGLVQKGRAALAWFEFVSM